MNDTEKALKKIEEAMRKIQIPTISFDGIAFKTSVEAAIKREDRVYALEKFSGMSLDELVGKFAAGWELKPPSHVMGFTTDEFMESMRKEIEDEIRRAGYLDSRKFDAGLLKHQLENMDEMKCYGVDLEEIGSGTPDKIRPVWNLDIDFDSKYKEETK